jgi:hypothetical protein
MAGLHAPPIHGIDHAGIYRQLLWGFWIGAPLFGWALVTSSRFGVLALVRLSIDFATAASGNLAIALEMLMAAW